MIFSLIKHCDINVKAYEKTLNITHAPHFCKITQIIGNGSVYINRLFHIKEEVPLVGKR